MFFPVKKRKRAVEDGGGGGDRYEFRIKSQALIGTATMLATAETSFFEHLFYGRFFPFCHREKIILLVFDILLQFEVNLDTRSSVFLQSLCFCLRFHYTLIRLSMQKAK